jgi:hypothetical protein
MFLTNKHCLVPGGMINKLKHSQSFINDSIFFLSTLCLCKQALYGDFVGWLIVFEITLHQLKLSA